MSNVSFWDRRANALGARAGSVPRELERRGLAWPALALLLFGTACSANGSGAGTDTGVGDGTRVCAKCRASGGETSDFGLLEPPTACQLSEQPTSIDEAGARSLGFGPSLDLYARTFTLPLAWTANDSSLRDGAQPARGYASPTAITMTTSIGDITHVVPKLQGCEDHLLVTLQVSLSTADGAIAVSGPVYADAKRVPLSFASGMLDLGQAQGSLLLFPPPWPNLEGYLAVLMSFTPDAVRGMLNVELLGPVESGDMQDRFEPLAGKFPIDDCDYSERAVSSADPTVTPSGKTALEFDDDLNAILQRPRSATWSGGAQTQVSASIGLPTSLCQRLDNQWLRYVSIPLAIVSTDGRANVEGVADGLAAFDATGAPETVWFERSGIVPTEKLSETVGISGVDLAGEPGASWNVGVAPFASLSGGTIRVVGVRADGRLMDENGNSVSETLTWPY